MSKQKSAYNADGAVGDVGCHLRRRNVRLPIASRTFGSCTNRLVFKSTQDTRILQKTVRPTSLATRPYPLRFGWCDERKDVHKNGDATEEHAIEQWTRGGRRRERSTRLIEVSRHSIQPRCGVGSDEKLVPSRLVQRADESGR